ncbi:fanconi-associated nuclease 1 [Stegostoma tigrinum]|uniref:fanconi-associated nuclease 1 n=1 Tax=Stegostoma tigrinum TaxID=3053191 RepID=UPI0028707DA4|nr:fanconi-associated nuclease 1 [Stegostoma tigrinum]
MLSPPPKRPCSRLSLRARRNALAPGRIQATAPEAQVAPRRAAGSSGGLPCKLSRRHRRAAPAPAPAQGDGAAPAQGEGAAPAPAQGDGAAPAPAPAQGEGAAPAPAPAQGEGAAPAQGEGAAPAQGEGAAPAQGEGAAPAPAPAQGEGAAPAPAPAQGEGAAPAPAPAPAQGEGAAPAPAPAQGEGAAPAQGEGAAPAPAPAQGEGAAPAPAPAPAQGEGAAPAPAQGEGAAPAPAPAQGEGAAPAPAPAQGEGAAPAPAQGEGAAPADGLTPEWGRPPLPYYLRNFLLVMETVLASEDKELFNEADDHWLGTFQKLSVTGQKLYVRLFQRKLNWLKVTKLNYPEIGLNLTPIIEELRLAGLLLTESDLCNVSEALNLLSAPELKLLARSFHLRPQGQRAEILESLLRLSKQQSIFSCSQKPSSPGLALLNRVKMMIGNCVRVATPARAVFSRLLLLFNLTDYTDEEEAACAGQNQLFTVLLVNKGHVTFPNYTVLRKKKIFRHRDDLLRYDEAVHSLAEMITAMTNGVWSDALQIYKIAREKWSRLENNSDVRFHQQLPVYLRCFTAGWVYTRIQFHGVEVLQRLHMYADAVEELQNLLGQSIYCPGSRGHWWNRLSLNLHQHLKQTDQAIHCLWKGLDDVWVHLGHRLALYQRALRIRDSPSCKKWCHLLQDLPVVSVEDVPHVTIKARSCPGMGNALFLMDNISEGSSLGQGEPCSTVICSVEEVSLAYYQQQGFDQGIHGEGTTFLTLFGLLFWDIIFLSGIPDVFRNPYQACPLDLYTDCFYQQRRECIESRVDFLENASIETLCTLIADAWNGYRGINATLVNWEIFNSLQQVQSLVSCLGGPFLSSICKILAKDLRHGRGGLPDLVVWNSHRCQYKLAEVKGPSDQLSHKQMVWLDQLQRLGADVEVCHVNVVGARSHQLS